VCQRFASLWARTYVIPRRGEDLGSQRGDDLVAWRGRSSRPSPFITGKRTIEWEGLLMENEAV